MENPINDLNKDILLASKSLNLWEAPQELEHLILISQHFASRGVCFENNES